MPSSRWMVIRLGSNPAGTFGCSLRGFYLSWCFGFRLLGAEVWPRRLDHTRHFRKEVRDGSPECGAMYTTNERLQSMKISRPRNPSCPASNQHHIGASKTIEKVKRERRLKRAATRAWAVLLTYLRGGLWKEKSSLRNKLRLMI